MTRWIAPLALALAAGCLPESVDVVVLTPTTPEVEQVLLAADARWEAAGVAPDRIQIAPGGAPVRLVPERCGSILPGKCVAETRRVMRGHAFRGVRWMELYDLDVDVAAHEMGHALGIKFHIDADVESYPDGVADCGSDGAHRPLMCSSAGPAIVASDLDAACSAGACERFTPEL
jgi:hypothetical protein